MKKVKSLIIALALLLSLGTTSVYADDFGTYTQDTGPFADNSIHNYCIVGSLPSYWTSPMEAAMTNLDNQTVMTTGVQFACNDDADVTFFRVDSSIMGNNLGLSFCNKWTHISGVCAGAYVLLNSDYLVNTSYRHKTACHEVGHTVGLTHGSAYGGCMISGLSTLNTYSTHHVNHINSYY
jgi:predicted Zn-dependent protease